MDELTDTERNRVVNRLDTLAGEARTLARIYEDLAETVAVSTDPDLLGVLAGMQSELAPR